MNRRECRDKLSLYIDGQLTDEERLRLEDALERYPDCAEELAVLRSLVAELEQFEPVAVPTKLLQDLKCALRNEVALSKTQATGGKSLLLRLGAWRVAASIAALLFAGWVVVQDQGQVASKVSSLAEETAELDAVPEEEETEADMEDGDDDLFAPSRRFATADSKDGKKRSTPARSEKSAAKSPARQSAPKSAHGVGESAKKTFPAQKKAAGKRDRSVPEDENADFVGAAGSASVADSELDLLASGFRRLDSGFRQAEIDTDTLKRFKASALGRSIHQDARRSSNDDKQREWKKTRLRGSFTKEIDKGGFVPRRSRGQEAIAMTAFFAFGPDATGRISSLAKKSGLSFQVSDVSNLGKRQTKKGSGNLLTFEMSVTERDEFLAQLQGASQLPLKLFGDNSPALSTKSSKNKRKSEASPRDVPKGGGALKKGKKGVTRGEEKLDESQSMPAQEKAKRTPIQRVRLSFIILDK